MTSAAASVATEPVLLRSQDTEAPLAKTLRQHLEQVEQALAGTLADPASASLRNDFECARRALADTLRQWPKREREHPVFDDFRQTLIKLNVSGAQDAPPSPEDQVVITSLDPANWPELLALMVLSPAWRCAQAPLLGRIPDAWWGAYSHWLFTPPQGFLLPGDAETHATHVLLHLRELTLWVTKNPGSRIVRDAALTYIRISCVIQLYFSAGHLREHAELRGQILQRYRADKSIDTELPALPREGRRLRIGFVNRHLSPQTETYTTVPCFEHLDPEHFEVLLFVCCYEDTPIEAYCRACVSNLEILPADVPSQVSTLQAANLDVLVFGTNLTAIPNQITLLALHRCAPLQIVNNSSCITSGLPHVDLYVSGTLTETPEAHTHFSERLGLLPGPTHAFNYEADREQPVQAWTRADLGIPADAFVFASAANYYKIIPEMRETWARLLAATPGSRLLLHPFNPNWSSNYPIKRFCAEFEAVLTRHGVDHDRLIVSSMKLPSRADVSALMGIADLYLDTAPFGGVNSLIDPLEAGVPVVAWDGTTMRARMGGALLRSLGEEQLVATDATSYEAIALRLAHDPAERAQVATRLKAAMERGPVFLDTLAASDTFGALVQSAYDEIARVGTAAFRRNRAPLRATHTPPLDHAQRHAYGKSLLAQGRHERAVTYLLAALNHHEDDPTVWLDLARALHASGRHNDAISALESALRLDETLTPGWALLAELADLAGNTDLATQARQIVASQSPQTKPASEPLF